VTIPLMDAFEPGGQALYDSLAEDGDSASLLALITEVARIKDRLDRLHALIQGDDNVWMHLVPSRGNVEVLEIRMDSAAQEARQLATVFRQLLVEIERRHGGDSEEVDDSLDV
jgi:hypothetical protein